jgi:DNA-binding transcriptional regulator YiaG
MIIGEALRRARERIGENQVEFAKRFGVAQPVLSRWETGRVRPGGAVQMLIKRILADLAQEAAE